MKRYSALSLTTLLALLVVLQGATLAQKKRPSGTKRRAAGSAPAPTFDMRAEANQVADQLKNVTKFLYIYGKVANGIEFADDQAKRGQVSPNAVEKNKQSKSAVVTQINGLRAGLDNLTRNFKSNPRLQVQYLKVSYASEAAANAEQLAAAGRFEEAGKALVNVVERLTDAIMSMRLQ